MIILNRNCKTSFVKPVYLKKAQSANPRLYDIGCYNDILALMLDPESDETIHHTQEIRSKLIESLRSQLGTQKTQFSNEIDRLSREYYYVDHMNVILGVYTTLNEHLDLACNYLETLEKCERLESELSKRTENVNNKSFNELSKRFSELEQHSINLEISLQQSQEQIKHDKVWKQKESSSFRELNDKFFEIQDLKAQLQDKNIAISELKKLTEKMKGKSVETKFEKPSVIRKPNAFKYQRQSISGKPTTFSDSLEKKDFSNSRVHTRPNQTRVTQLPQDIRKTNKRVSFSTRVNPTTSVSIPQLKSTQLEDRVLHNNSQGKKQEVEDHCMIFLCFNNKTSVTACNDSLNVKTSNVNFVYVTCGKCVLNENHDLFVLHYINGVNSRTNKPIAVPISTREPKRSVNQSIATPHKKIVASEPTIQKPRSTFRKLYEHVSKTCSWWYPKITPHRYKWKPKSKIGNVTPNISVPLGTESRTTNILEPKTVRGPNLSNTPLSSNSFAGRRDNSIHRRLWVLKAHDGKSQASKSGSRQFAFWKSTCYVHDLKGNDLLTGSRGTDLYSITLQDTTSPNPICLMAKATSSQEWLWRRRLSHLNFDTINLLSKNDIVIGLPKLKFVKDHLCSCELGKAKLKSFKTKTTPSSKRRLQLLHMDLCGLMRVESINGKKYVLVIVDDYSRYTWTHFLRSKDETPEVLIDFLRLVQRGLHAQQLQQHVSLKTVHSDGETLDKMKEKGDACIFVGYSTVLKGYRVYNKRTRLIVETIHVNFDELPHMASDHVNETVTTLLNKLDILFSPMFDEYFNGAPTVVLKSSVVSSADASDKHHQQNTTSFTSTIVAADLSPLIIQTTPEPITQEPTVIANENIDQAENVMVDED
ncbi:retrovirus-related pol polyprotein from transposon TNT 1-94 [Tanacetum coccineum]